MKIYYMSDLHLEFGDLDTDYMEGGEILILAGDIDVWTKRGYRMFEWMNNLPFDDVLFVPGNHEFYSKGKISHIRRQMLEKVEQYTDVHLLWNKKIELKGQTFVGTPLWSNFDNGNPQVMAACERGISDFLTTMLSDNVFWTPEEMTKDWRFAYEFLGENIVLGNEIVITHWAPSLQSSHPKFAGEIMNPYWCNSMDRFVETMNPKVWVHGHCHYKSDYMIGETRVLCNPRGYKNYEENPEFNINAYFEV